MVVELDERTRGTHMSRFVEVLDAHAVALNPSSLRVMVASVRERLATDRARVSLRFPYFLRRRAPVSGMEGMVRYEGRVGAIAGRDGTEIRVGVQVPITSLCPCSKEISDYGAHNQRGYVEIEVVSPWSAGEASGIWLDDLIGVAEAAGSAPIYSLLKRSDEREVTMQAYDNPAFVEDIVRDVVVSLRDDVRVAQARVKVTNQESIHDHSAIAEVQWSRSYA
jgi:GTP cyclohydrolase FolE2